MRGGGRGSLLNDETIIIILQTSRSLSSVGFDEAAHEGRAAWLSLCDPPPPTAATFPHHPGLWGSGLGAFRLLFTGCLSPGAISFPEATKKKEMAACCRLLEERGA